jgi:hypothetical protein
MKAIHGGKSKNDRLDSRKIAGLLRSGMIPQAYVYPAEMHATRDLLRRRNYLMRRRAILLAHPNRSTIVGKGTTSSLDAGRPHTG